MEQKIKEPNVDSINDIQLEVKNPRPVETQELGSSLAYKEYNDTVSAIKSIEEPLDFVEVKSFDVDEKDDDPNVRILAQKRRSPKLRYQNNTHLQLHYYDFLKNIIGAQDPFVPDPYNFLLQDAVALFSSKLRLVSGDSRTVMPVALPFTGTDSHSTEWLRYTGRGNSSNTSQAMPDRLLRVSTGVIPGVPPAKSRHLEQMEAALASGNISTIKTITNVQLLEVNAAVDQVYLTMDAYMERGLTCDGTALLTKLLAYDYFNGAPIDNVFKGVTDNLWAPATGASVVSTVYPWSISSVDQIVYPLAIEGVDAFLAQVRTRQTAFQGNNYAIVDVNAFTCNLVPINRDWFHLDPIIKAIWIALHFEYPMAINNFETAPWRTTLGNANPFGVNNTSYSKFAFSHLHIPDHTYARILLVVADDLNANVDGYGDYRIGSLANNILLDTQANNNVGGATINFSTLHMIDSLLTMTQPAIDSLFKWAVKAGLFTDTMLRTALTVLSLTFPHYHPSIVSVDTSIGQFRDGGNRMYAFPFDANDPDVSHVVPSVILADLLLQRPNSWSGHQFYGTGEKKDCFSIPSNSVFLNLAVMRGVYVYQDSTKLVNNFPAVRPQALYYITRTLASTACAAMADLMANLGFRHDVFLGLNPDFQSFGELARTTYLSLLMEYLTENLGCNIMAYEICAPNMYDIRPPPPAASQLGSGTWCISLFEKHWWTNIYFQTGKSTTILPGPNNNAFSQMVNQTQMVLDPFTDRNVTADLWVFKPNDKENRTVEYPKLSSTFVGYTVPSASSAQGNGMYFFEGSSVAPISHAHYMYGCQDVWSCWLTVNARGIPNISGLPINNIVHSNPAYSYPIKRSLLGTETINKLVMFTNYSNYNILFSSATIYGPLVSSTRSRMMKVALKGQTTSDDIIKQLKASLLVKSDSVKQLSNPSQFPL